MERKRHAHNHIVQPDLQASHKCIHCKKPWNLRVSLSQSGLKESHFEPRDETVRECPDVKEKFVASGPWFHSPLPYEMLVRNYCLDVPLLNAPCGLHTQSVLSEQCSVEEHDAENWPWVKAKGPFQAMRTKIVACLRDVEGVEMSDLTGASLSLVEKVPLPASALLRSALRAIGVLPGSVVTKNFRKLEYVSPTESCLTLYVVLVAFRTIDTKEPFTTGKLMGCLNGGFTTVTRRIIRHRPVSQTTEAQGAISKQIKVACEELNLKEDELRDYCVCGTSLYQEGAVIYGDCATVEKLYGYELDEKSKERVEEFVKWPLVQWVVEKQAKTEFTRVFAEMRLAVQGAEAAVLRQVDQYIAEKKLRKQKKRQLGSNGSLVRVSTSSFYSCNDSLSSS